MSVQSVAKHGWLGLMLTQAVTTVIAQSTTNDDLIAENSVEVGQPARIELRPDTAIEPSTDDKAVRHKRTIEEIVVTATKRESSTRDLPISIDAFSGEDLEARGANSMEEFLRYSPGVSVNQGLDQDSVFVAIRGITANSQGGFFNRPTGLFYNDVTLVNPSIRGPEPNMDPFDMAAVEVLKGPQGTLFGGSALAGAVRFVPVAPSFDESGLSGRFTSGVTHVAQSHDFGHNLGLAANYAFGDQVALRAAGSLRRNAGTIDDLFTMRQDINSGGSDQYRILALWHISDSLSAEGTFLHREAFQNDGSRGDDVAARTIESRRRPDTSRSFIEIPRLQINWALDRFDLVFSASRLRKTGLLDFDQTRTLSLHDTTTVAHQFVDPLVTQPAAELRIVSSRPSEGFERLGWMLNNWDYTLGLFWQRSDQFIDLPIYTQALGGVPILGGDSPENEALGIVLDAIASEQAIYFDTTRHFDNFDLNLGGRIFRQKTAGGSATYSQGQPVSNGRATLRESGINPKLSLTWLGGEHISVYGAVTRGFRYGGINPVYEPDTPLTFKSDMLWNYEVGLRSEWFNRQLLADLTLFHIDWTDVQIDQVSTGVLSYALNVGQVRSQGVEIATRMLLPFRLSLDANAAIIDSRTTVEFESVDGTVPPGTRMPATPKLSGSAQLSHATEFGAWEMSGTLSVTFASDSTNLLLPTYELPGGTLMNLAVAFTRADLPAQPRLSLNLNNLTNEEHLVSVQTNIGVGVETVRTWFNAPRTVALNLSLRF